GGALRAHQTDKLVVESVVGTGKDPVGVKHHAGSALKGHQGLDGIGRVTALGRQLHFLLPGIDLHDLLAQDPAHRVNVMDHHKENGGTVLGPTQHLGGNADAVVNPGVALDNLTQLPV